MKPRIFKPLMIVLVVALGFASCNPLGKMAKEADSVTYNANPNPLEMHNDSVAVVISGKIPTKYLHKKTALEVTPFFESNGQVVKTFNSFTLVGEDSDIEGDKIIKFEEGGGYTFEYKYPYEDGMENGVLKAKVVGKFKSKEKDIIVAELAKGTVITPLLVQSDEKPTLGKDLFQRITTEVYNAEILYLINSSVVRNSELADQDMKDLFATIKEKAQDSTYMFKRLDVMAYASPDGELTLNENLADHRAQSAGKVVKAKLRRNKVEAAKEDSFYNLVGKGEDWEGFKQKMQQSNIEDKDLIIRVLQMYSDPQKREAEIKNLAETYEEIKEQILPPLRRSQIALTIDKVGRSDAEIANLAQNDPAQLSVEELLYAATLTNDLNAKLGIYKKCTEQFPKDWRGFNNVGYIYLLQNKINDAEASLNQALSLSPNQAEVLNNLGIIYRLRGDLDKAMSYYDKAGAAGKNVNYNKGIINIKQGEYGTAVANFGDFKTLNAALAQILDGDYQKALNTIDASEDANSAAGYYLKAIAGARMQNEELMMKNLKMAISKDASYKEKAKKDVEFYKYDLSNL